MATLSGTWDAFIYCTSQTTDSAVIRFNIDNDKGGPFKTTGHGTDYNRTPLSFVLSGNDDQVASVASETLFVADGSRSDSFSQKLAVEDSTTPQTTNRQAVPTEPMP